MRRCAPGRRDGAGYVDKKKRVARTDRGESLLQISLAINAHKELRSILETIVTHTRSLLGCADSSIVLWDRRRGVFKHGASTNIGAEVSRRVRREGGATRWVVDHCEAVLVPDTRRDPFIANPMIPEGGVMAYTGVPIAQGDEVLGVLYALYATTHKATPDDLWLLTQAAALAAIAIQNSRLLHSLEEINNFKSAMIRMLVHDLNNILQSLMGGIEILRHCNRDADHDDLERVDVSVTRMRRLVEGILRYERMTSVEEIRRGPVDLNAVAEKAATVFAEAAAEKSHRLVLALSSQPCMAYGDRLLLEEAAFNLVSNAVNYTPKGGTITLRTRVAEDGYVFEVADTGPGLAVEDRERIFEPFVRLKAAGQVKGSGLGLHLVRTIVDRHAGTIAVFGRPGKGATFTVTLPSR